jgi:hypothetical protein
MRQLAHSAAAFMGTNLVLAIPSFPARPAFNR